MRNLPFGLGGLAWINRAPVDLLPGNPGNVRLCLETVARHYADKHGYYVRMAPPLAADATVDATGSLRVTGTPGWASADLDLTRPADDLLKSLRSNWRNSLRKAEKSGIDVACGTDDVAFNGFLDQYRSFVADRKFSTTVTPDFLSRLQSLLPEDRKLTVHTASQNGELLASVLVARYGSTCEYLAGASAGRPAGMGLGQLLLWRAILEAQSRGCTRFDLGGLEPGVTPKGIYDFKSGVNPTAYRLMNEIEAGDRTLVQKFVRAYVARTRAAAAAAPQ